MPEVVSSARSARTRLSACNKAPRPAQRKNMGTSCSVGTGWCSSSWRTTSSSDLHPRALDTGQIFIAHCCSGPHARAWLMAVPAGPASAGHASGAPQTPPTLTVAVLGPSGKKMPYATTRWPAREPSCWPPGQNGAKSMGPRVKKKPRKNFHPSEQNDQQWHTSGI